MFRTSVANVSAHRTCLPLYEIHQATPVATFLDANETGQIYSGMVATKTGADEVSLCNATQAPFGLFALDKNDVIDDLDGLDDLQPFAVWQGGPDAYFQIDSPAFDDAQTYTISDGAVTALYSNASGELTSVDGTGPPVAELIEVVSSTRIIIRLQAPSGLATS